MFPVFENNFLLQATGWAVLHSLWQVTLLYLIYQSIHSLTPKHTGAIKYKLAQGFMLAAFGWFTITIARNYFLLVDGSFADDLFIGKTIKIDLLKVNTILPFISLAYFVALAFYLFFFARNIYSAQQLRNSGLSKSPFDIRLFTNATALHLGIKKKVQVWVSEKVDVPSVIGFLKPMILLPAAALNNLSVSQAEAIIVHELAHIKRNDYLQNLIFSLIQDILFFNPFVHLLMKQMKNERENCCDDWVMNYGYDAGNYARALLALEQQRHNNIAFALAATNNKKLLLDRIKRLFIVDEQILSTGKQRTVLYAMASLLLLLVFNCIPLLKENKQETAQASYSIKGNLIAIPAVYATTQKEVPSATPIDNMPVAFTKTVKNEPEKKKIKPAVKKPVQPIEQELEFTRAIVNEEMIKAAAEADALVTPAAEKESDEKKLLIKIEEEVSGNKNTNTYYLQLDNATGNLQVTPILILKKSTIKIAVDSLQKQVDKLKLEVKNKFRITS